MRRQPNDNRSFQRGSGVFTCRACHKQTRGNRDSAALDLCARCYDIAGDENAVSDGHMTVEEFVERWGQPPDC